MSRLHGLTRIRFFGGTMASIAAVPLGGIPLEVRSNPMTAIAKTTPNSVPSDVHPFRINVSEAQLEDLRSRLRATKWPTRETVLDDSQGVPLAMIREVTRRWATDYNWRTCESRLNSLPQFTTQIDGLNIHFIHVRSKHENAMPLIMTHGWPGSVLEFMNVIGPLTDPTSYGASASDAFHLVIPSIPGFGFSAQPTSTGWGPEHVARAWVALMARLGYDRFAAQGGDMGAIITNVMGEQAPPQLLGIHVNFPAFIPTEIVKAVACGDPPPPNLAEDERLAYEQFGDQRAKHFAYYQFMTTRPQTLYGVADSPAGLAAWLLDHGDLFGQPAAAFVSAIYGRPVEGYSSGSLTLTDILDDITLYWVTNTGVSSGRIYWENMSRYGSAASNITVPAAVSVFPGESLQAPRSWTERSYHELIYYNKVERGGHFAAWEQPQLFSREVRAGLRSLRAT